MCNEKPSVLSPTCEPGLANTEVVIGQLDAVKTVRGTAGIRQTLIYVPLTSLSCESRRTVATIAAYSVHTGAIVQTLWWGIVQPQRGTTIIFIDLTENTFQEKLLLNISHFESINLKGTGNVV